MANVKRHFLKVDYIDTDKLRELHERIQRYNIYRNLGDFTSDDDIPNLRAVKSLVTSFNPITVDLTSSNPQRYIYTFSGVVSRNFQVYGRQSITSPDTGHTVWVGYEIGYFLDETDNTITLIRSDAGDNVRVVIVPIY